jgi:hypothetical protein
VNIALAGSAVAIAPATLASNGTFSFNLNQEVPDSQLPTQSSLDNLKGLCDDTAAVKLMASNPSSRNVGAQIKVKTASVDQIAAPALATFVPATAATPGSSTLTVGTIVYSNAANTLTDNQTCKLNGKDVNLKVNISLVRGWNAIALTATFNSGTPTLTYETKALPTRWIVFNAPPTLTP